MDSEFDPVGYVSGVLWDPNGEGGYIPVVHFYEPGRPGEIIWRGGVYALVTVAMNVAAAHLKSLSKPSEDDVLLALRRVLDVIGNAGNLMAITHSDAVTSARTMVAMMGGKP